MKRSNWLSSLETGVRCTAVAAVAALVAASASAAIAQDDTKIKAGLEIWKSSGCADCHGAFADGDKQRDEAPTGANLRTSRLDAATLKQTISCGRPGADMPAFDEGAYKVRPCYGAPLGAAPDNLYPASRTLSPADIDLVIAYLQARMARTDNARGMPRLLCRRPELVMRRYQVSASARQRPFLNRGDGSQCSELCC